MLTRLIGLARGRLPSRCAALFALLGFAAQARATGPNEAMLQVVVDPARPEHMVILYANGPDGSRRGLLLSEDGGKSLRVLCSDCIHEQAARATPTTWKADLSAKYELRRMRAIALASGAATLVSTPAGLLEGDAFGCGFRAEPQFADQTVTRLVPHPVQPELSFALLGSEGPAQGLWRRGADGVWARFGAAESAPAAGQRVVLKSMALAKNDSDVRVYQTIWRYDEVAAKGRSALRVSDDGALTWREHALASDPEELELLAVDPTDRERVLGVIRRHDNGASDWSKELDLLMLSDDGGQSFRPYLEVAALSTATFGADGALWVGDYGVTLGEEFRAGLFRAAPGLKAAPVKLRPEPHQCVTYVPSIDRYYACQDARLGRLDPQTGALEELGRLNTVTAVANCPGLDTQRLCKELLCDTGYCLVSHYPRTPFCVAYDAPHCGPRSLVEPDVASSTDGGAPADGGEPAEGGEPGVTSDRRDASEPEASAVTEGSDDAGVGGEPDLDQGASGCDGCRLGTTSTSRPQLWGAGLTLLAWLARRRRRAAASDDGGSRAA